MRSILYLLFIGLISLVSAQTMGKQTIAQLEESPAGTKILWFIDAVNEGKAVTEEQVTQMFDVKLIEKMGMDFLQEAIADIQDNDGTLTVYSIKRKKVTEYTLDLKGEKSGSWLKMKMFFQDQRPYKIAGFLLDSAPEEEASTEPIYPLKN